MTDPFPRVLPVGDGAVTVELGASLDEATVGRVRALDDRILKTALDGVLESVPTYASLLVLYDRRRISFKDLAASLLRLTKDLEASQIAGRLIEIPTLYDGEDLAEVASRCHLKTSDVVEIHSGRDYNVLMLGFSPGFGYLGFIDERLKLPRRKTPRTRVPKGSVAIAGPQTGIYPRSLPGGWNLLGRTSISLFDPNVSESGRGPSVLAPGDRVRFVPASDLPEAPAPHVTEYSGAGITVVEPGIMTTIQDVGRPGLRRVAVPLSGCADPESARRANQCLGRAPGDPVIEVCAPGVSLRFERTAFIALTGAQVSAELERPDLDGGRMEVSMNVAVRVRASNLLHFTGLSGGARAYLSVTGLQAPRVLDSASVDLTSAFLRPLQRGDGLTIGAFDSDRVRREAVPPAPRRETVRVILGPQHNHFDRSTIDSFLSTEWKLGLDSDRVGARLDGLKLTHQGATEVVSDGMIPGCIQVPPDGRPIVMLADCPTTGGYPKIACVINEDLGLVAQAVAGQTRVRFREVRIEDVAS